jgi:hypothetical protein
MSAPPPAPGLCPFRRLEVFFPEEKCPDMSCLRVLPSRKPHSTRPGIRCTRTTKGVFLGLQDPRCASRPEGGTNARETTGRPARLVRLQSHLNTKVHGRRLPAFTPILIVSRPES